MSEDELRVYGQDDDERPQSTASRPRTNQSNRRTPPSHSGDESAFPDFQVRYSAGDTGAKSRFYPIPGRGRRAHVTLGTAEGVAPVNTGFDVLKAVQAEKKSAEGSWSGFVRQYDVEGAVLRQYERALWVLYPDRVAALQALFSGHYV